MGRAPSASRSPGRPRGAGLKVAPGAGVAGGPASPGQRTGWGTPSCSEALWSLGPAPLAPLQGPCPFWKGTTPLSLGRHLSSSSSAHPLAFAQVFSALAMSLLCQPRPARVPAPFCPLGPFLPEADPLFDRPPTHLCRLGPAVWTCDRRAPWLSALSLGQLGASGCRTQQLSGTEALGSGRAGVVWMSSCWPSRLWPR